MTAHPPFREGERRPTQAWPVRPNPLRVQVWAASLALLWGPPILAGSLATWLVSHGTAPWVAGALGAPSVLVGMVLVFRRARETWQLELTDREVRLVAGARVKWSAPRLGTTAERRLHRVSGRYGTFEYPALVLSHPSAGSCVLGSTVGDRADRGPRGTPPPKTPDVFLDGGGFDAVAQVLCAALRAENGTPGPSAE